MNLLTHSTGRYIAYADNDDIWEDSRLRTAVEILRDQSEPALVVSHLVDFHSGKLIDCDLLHAPRNYMKNEIHGFTQLFNHELRELAVLANQQNIEMHDWWINLVAQTFGKVFFTSEGSVRFRIHNDNNIGAPDFQYKLVFFIKLFLRRGKMSKLLSQARELQKFTDNEFHINDHVSLSVWISSVSGPIYVRSRYE
jgi:hypothetical protein